MQTVAHQSRTGIRRARHALKILDENSALLPQNGWVHLGCGGGESLHLAKERALLAPGENWGIEISAEKIQEAREFYPDLAEWVQAAPDETPLPDGVARVALLFENNKPASRFLGEISRLARKNAVVLLALPESNKHDLFWKILQKIYEENPRWRKKEKNSINPTLEDLIQQAPKYNLLPFWGATFYEPTGYSSAEKRWEEIREEKRADIDNLFRDDFHSRVWKEISHRWQESLPLQNTYRHHGFSSYLLMRATA